MSNAAVEQMGTDLMNEGARSVFLYGSRARGDHTPNSDWEVGVIFDDENYVSRSTLRELQINNAVIYPFKYGELEQGTVKTPFTPSIWLTEIIAVAKTIAGEDILSKMPKPEITDTDILCESAFLKARALDAMVAQREGHQDLASDLFAKSSLLGARALLLANKQPFPMSYPKVAKAAARMLGDKASVLKVALDIRNGERDISSKDAFDNIDLQLTITNLIKQAIGQESAEP